MSIYDIGLLLFQDIETDKRFSSLYVLKRLFPRYVWAVDSICILRAVFFLSAMSNISIFRRNEQAHLVPNGSRLQKWQFP